MLPNSRYHTPSESSYPPDLHKPSRQDEAVRGRNKTRDRDRAGSDQTPDYPGQQFTVHPHHPWNNNNHSQSTPRNQSPADSNGSSSGNKKGRGRKVKKSESESGISKLLKTLRKDSSGKKAEKLRGREASASSSTLDGRFRLQRRGSLDRSPTRKRGSSPDRRRAKSMDRRAERAQRDRTPERECDDGGFLTMTPERKFYERRVLKDSAASGRMRDFGTPERSNNNSDTLSYTRGRTLDRPAKNGNLLRDSSSERYRANGTPERRYRDSSPDSTYSREEPNYGASAPSPRLKDYYSMMKNNAAQYNHAAYNNAGHNNNSAAAGRASNQLPEPKRRLYKESPKDLSI